MSDTPCIAPETKPLRRFDRLFALCQQELGQAEPKPRKPAVDPDVLKAQTEAFKAAAIHSLQRR